MDRPYHNPHPSYTPFTVIVRTPETTAADLTIGHVYLMSCPTGHGRYVGSTTDMPHRESVTLSGVQTLHSPLYRHLREHGVTGWQTHEICRVEFDARRCPNALLEQEDAAMQRLRSDGAQLLNKNKAVRTCRQSQNQRAWREAHPDYMKTKCREWRQRKKEEAEQLADDQ